jgi:GNAT superfamily N-acetyltransferase
MALRSGLRLDIGDLGPDEVEEAVGVLARGMRDNPVHVAVFGPDPDRRTRTLLRMFGQLFRVMSAYGAIVARHEGAIVGVAGHAEGGGCRPTALQRLRFAPTLIGLGPRTAARASRWMSDWASRDPDEPHSHFGPFAVDSHLQGQGIGTVLLEEYCKRLDAGGELGYLETDKAENVRLYERHGFQVVDQAEVMGVQNWFMRRPPMDRA